MGLLSRKLLPPGRSQTVELGALVGLSLLLLARDPTLLFQTVKGRVQRTRFDLEHIAGVGPDRQADRVAMLRRAPPEVVFLATPESVAGEFRAAAQSHSADMQMRVQNADMRPYPSTRAETGMAQSVRPMHAIAGLKRGGKNCFLPLRPRGLHVAAATFAARVAEQTRDLWPLIPC